MNKIIINNIEHSISGNYFDELTPIVGIVGTRSCSPQGYKLSKQLAGILSSHGVGIISGGARGIDTAAHIGCLESGGHTGVVLGCGINVVYPSENKKLFEKIETTGFLLSEFEDNSSPKKWYFVKRNEIIAAICDILVVVEATKKGGAKITADFALDFGKEVFAIPGNISIPEAQGCNQLIYDGANILLDPSDILNSLNVSHRQNGWNLPNQYFDISSEDCKVLLSKINSKTFNFEEAKYTFDKSSKDTFKILLQMTQYKLLISKYGIWYKK